MIYVNRLTNLPEEIISTCTENSIKYHTNNIFISGRRESLRSSNSRICIYGRKFPLQARKIIS